MAEIKINMLQILERDGLTQPVVQVNSNKVGLVMLTQLVMAISENTGVSTNMLLAEVKNLAPQVQANVQKNERNVR
ncbi:hypothetical protein IL308_05575 [Lactococcus lactis]|uniref:hypothetical protein n=1 Tax=Lactococcus lactis TaxID=1358 RepID=UPI001914B4B4|nr:hypothetical protein [Lactococcus lactis]MBK5076261.1 hypothetical protein [Lactococcus lactis]WDA68865.1 hypothetical protein IL310_02110 [Lactococcus lactis]